MADLLPVKINYNVLRMKFRQRCDYYKIPEEEANVLVESCVALIRTWKNDGHIFDENDLNLAMKSCFASIRSKSQAAKNEKKVPGTLCWRCFNACPIRINNKYISGCSFSLHQMPVVGWKAEKGVVSYNVIECPEFVEG